VIALWPNVRQFGEHLGTCCSYIVRDISHSSHMSGWTCRFEAAFFGATFLLPRTVRPTLEFDESSLRLVCLYDVLCAAVDHHVDRDKALPVLILGVSFSTRLPKNSPVLPCLPIPSSPHLGVYLIDYRSERG
jgi:hypothetical protein